jgi:hypothetical protein
MSGRSTAKRAEVDSAGRRALSAALRTGAGGFSSEISSGGRIRPGFGGAAGRWTEALRRCADEVCESEATFFERESKGVSNVGDRRRRWPELWRAEGGSFEATSRAGAVMFASAFSATGPRSGFRAFIQFDFVNVRSTGYRRRTVYDRRLFFL